VLALATVTALVAASSPALAQGGDARDQSRAAFRRGVAQAAAGNYAGARDSFQEAYRLFPHPSILLNLGIARAHSGEWVEAEQDLVHFLADDGGAQPDELASARAELAQTRRHLGTFRLRVLPGGARASLDAHPVALLPGAFVEVRTTRGSHDLHVAADGFPPVDRVVDVAGERAPDVDIALSAQRKGPQPTPPPSPGDGQRTAGWFLVGGAIVAAGVAVYAGSQAISLANEYNTAGSEHFQDPSTKASGIVFRTSADIALLGALALGGVGAYFLLTASDAAPAQAGLVVGPWTGIAGSF
jgi:tetratricopeptide (TPR) repeat protein